MGKGELKMLALGVTVVGVAYYLVNAYKAKARNVKTVLASNGYVTSPIKSEIIYT